VDGLELSFSHFDLITRPCIETVARFCIVCLEVPHGLLMLINIKVWIPREIIIGVLIAHYSDYEAK